MRPAKQVRIDAARLAQVMQWHLLVSVHDGKIESEMCVMEAVAYIAGEPWSDAPVCACPVISAFMRNWNDLLPEDDRDRLLKPLIPKLVGTKSTKEIEGRRSFMALDWLIRVHTPAWLDRVESLKTHALVLRDMEEISDLAGSVVAGKKVTKARAAAEVAAWDAAVAAVAAAAGAAARDAAWDAAVAAVVAAEAAARAAAVAAARAALRHTVECLQISAVQLIERMCEVTK